MTTRLTKPVAREVETRRDGPLIITLTPEGVVVREKGRRKAYPPIAYGKLLMDAARLQVLDDKTAKAYTRAMRTITGVRP